MAEAVIPVGNPFDLLGDPDELPEKGEKEVKEVKRKEKKKSGDDASWRAAEADDRQNQKKQRATAPDFKRVEARTRGKQRAREKPRAQTRDQARAQTRDQARAQTCDQARAQTCDQARAQTCDQARAQTCDQIATRHLAKANDELSKQVLRMRIENAQLNETVLQLQAEVVEAERLAKMAETRAYLRWNTMVQDLQHQLKHLQTPHTPL